MKFSYKWLKEYFQDDLMSSEELEKVLVVKSFEVEGVEEKNGDQIFDLGITPNRNHDCLAHIGLAREISSVTGLKLKDIKFSDIQNVSPLKGGIEVEISSDKCKRYIGRKIENIKIGPSPVELKEKLEAIGERSINNIVDITNVVMFELGQPMHAFDADKISGNKIIVRLGNGESLTTLDNKEIILDESVLVIADSADVLAVGGIKGGKKAEIDFNTKNIILEAANFDSASTRKTSKKIGIATESSKRFEGEISPEIADLAMNRASELIAKYASDETTKIYEKIDVYPRPRHKFVTGVGLNKIRNVLGIEISREDVAKIFDQMSFKYEIIDEVNGKFVEEAKKYLGRPYKSGASISKDAPDLFDCSSLVSYCAMQFGLSIPRISVDQFLFSKKISEADLLMGDLVFSNTGLVITTGIHSESKEFLPGTKIESGVDHVGIYVGNGEVLHTSSKTEKAVVEKLSESEYFKNIVGYRRLFNKDDVRFKVEIPSERLDLMSKGPELGLEFSLIEEIGRIYGYDLIPEQTLPEIDFTAQINKEYQAETFIRKALSEIGFSEVITYSFVENGEVEPANIISSDKRFLRPSLESGMTEALNKNILNADLIGSDQIKMFEVGNVFPLSGEKRVLGISVKNRNGFKKPKASETLNEAVDALSKTFGVSVGVKIDDSTNFIQIDLSDLIKNDLGNEYAFGDYSKKSKYSPISVYPFMVRDVSVWIPDGNSSEDLINIIRDKSGSLLVKTRLFDQYSKDDRTSYAYRLVFQSQDKTLTDEEVNLIMESVYSEIKKQSNWEVR